MTTQQTIKEDISKLRDEDFINKILYLIYKVSDDPRYSTVSELVYILGKDQLYRLCSVLGGCTIKIPTLKELKIFTGALYIYYTIHTTDTKFEVALERLNLDQASRKQLFSIYKEVESILDE